MPTLVWIVLGFGVWMLCGLLTVAIACAARLSVRPQGRTGVLPAPAACSPRLRRKSRLCYTADANSPFEAYIYVR